MALFDMNLPSMGEVDDKKQRSQIKNYLYQLNEQLRYVLNNLGTENFTEDVQNSIDSIQNLSETVNKEITTLTENGSRLSSQIKQNAEEISLKVSKDSIISEINQTAEEIKILASRIKLEGYTTINGNFAVDLAGNMIAHNAILKGNLHARDTLYLYVTGEESIEEPIIASTTIGTDHPFINFLRNDCGMKFDFYNQMIDITAAGGVRINGDDVSLDGHTHDTLYNGNYTAFFSSSGNFANRNNGDLGSSTYEWGTAYLSSAPIVSSDKNAKHDIMDLSEVYRQIILRARPVQYKYNNGTSNRWHTGFIAQDVEAILTELGLTTSDFAGLIKSPINSVVNKNGEYDTTSEIIGYIYSLRYEEFISPAISVIQEQQEELNSIKEVLARNGIA